MKKRILALVLALTMLTGMLSVGVSAAEQTQGESYQVGYAKVDVNPWVRSDYISIGIPAQYTDADDNLMDYVVTSDENNVHASNKIVDITINDPNNPTQTVTTPFVSVKLAGYGTGYEQYASGISDDNGDGVVGLGDGLFVTATAVTDDWGKTVIYMTMDSIGAYERFVEDLRTEIINRLGRNVLSRYDIMMTASHSHEAPDLEVCRYAQEGTAWRAYYDYYLEQAVAAAVDAYNGRSEATVSKGTIDASDSMYDQGYIYPTYSNSNFSGTGMRMNFMRHYKVTNSDTSNVWISGDNFGVVPSGTDVSRGHVSSVNDKMNILQFTRTEGNPIVLVEWRAHASLLGGSTNTYLSSDYINALRYRLENNAELSGDATATNYCVGFLQGAAGDVNASANSLIFREFNFSPRNHAKDSQGYITVVPTGLKVAMDTTKASTNRTNKTYQNGVYGYLLGQIALDCLDSEMQQVSEGKIRNFTAIMDTQRQTYPDGLKEAVADWNAQYTTTQEKKDAGYPWYYEASDGETYMLNSYYHGLYVLNKMNSTGTLSLELHAMRLGEQVAMFVAPDELFDRYSLENVIGNCLDNDWLDLDSDTYGTPFFAGYSNARVGYIPNSLAYEYYTDPEGIATVNSGSYEANSSNFAQGTGEALIEKFGEMMQTVEEGYVTQNCPNCGADVEWQPLTKAYADTAVIGNGHYYLAEDLHRPGTTLNSANQKQFVNGQTVCINLNGYLMEAEGRVFDINSGATVTILDTPMRNAGDHGTVRGYSSSNNPGGGVATVASGATFNVYGGKIEFVPEVETGSHGTGVGGIVSLTGTMNLYGGTIQGADLVESEYALGNNGCGGAIYMYSGSTLNVSGGEILSGTVPEAGKGPCVFLATSTAKVTLSGDATVDDIYYNVKNTAGVTIDGEYTGTANLTIGFTPTDNTVIGKVNDGADYSLGSLSCDVDSFFLVEEEGQLKLSAYPDGTVAAIGSTGYQSLQAAVNAYTEGKLIRMITDETAATVVNKDVYLDLNGRTVSGTVNVTAGTLYCKDTATDDYDVTDGKYGKITNGIGSITGIPVESEVATDGYMKINESGALSFHRVNLQIYAMTLRPVTDGENMPSVYYKSNFKADSVVAAKIQRYGIAMNTTGVPTAANLESTCKYSSYTTFAAGAAGNSGNGTLLKGIMKPTNAELVNRRNAKVPVYGTAYIYTDDGYMLGGTEVRTLVQQTQGVDQIWDTELTEQQKSGIVAMYETYSAVMKTWDLPNLFKHLGLSQ